MIAVHRQKKPGTSIGILVRFSETIPITTCAEKIQESMIPIMMIDQTETFASVDGVRVVSIWRTSSNRTNNCDAEANEASMSRQRKNLEQQDQFTVD